MRQFILATGFEAEGTGASGKLTIKEAVDGSNVGLNLVLQRTIEEGGDILYPIYPKDFTWNVAPGAGAATANKFKATFTVPAVEKGLEYSVIFVKKGKQFNERSNWSFDVRSIDGDTATTIAEKIVKFVKDNKSSLGLTATNDEGAVTVEGVTVGDSYAIKLGGELTSLNPVKPSKAGIPAFMDAEMVKDLAAKCAADAGFEYTEDCDGLYPKFPISVPAGQYKVYTLRFTEPRVMGTREEAVYQIVQIALPSADYAEFESALDEYVVDVR